MLRASGDDDEKVGEGRRASENVRPPLVSQPARERERANRSMQRYIVFLGEVPVRHQNWLPPNRPSSLPAVRACACECLCFMLSLPFRHPESLIASPSHTQTPNTPPKIAASSRTNFIVPSWLLPNWPNKQQQQMPAEREETVHEQNIGSHVELVHVLLTPSHAQPIRRSYW